MHSFLTLHVVLLGLSLSTFLTVAQDAVVSSDISPHTIASRNHRRHHARKHRRGKQTSCYVSNKKKTSHKTIKTKQLNGHTSTNSTSSETYTSNSPKTSMGLVPGQLTANNVYIGFLPDEGDAGGTRTTMAQINKAIGTKSAAYGWYAQAHSGTPFDGSQLLAVMEDVKACGCVFQPAVMPMGGWEGLTESDNSQAIAIAKVMKKFTDQGIPVWLRFAHEMNYYQTDGTYNGNAEDFKAGWAAVAAACKKIAPEVKMWWTPNVAADSSYASYAPDDMSTVDLVGIDYYPKSISTGTEFVDTMKSFHDKYAVDGRMFAIGEIGLGYAGSKAERINWLKQIIAAKDQLPRMINVSWFNFQKGYDYRIVDASDSGLLGMLKGVLSH
ncbi:family 26 glycoside hydrolase [Melampsora americana]|nr:family 26 glycoside hydrolase [Melampsora americana]